LPATARESEFVATVAAFEKVSPANARRAYQTVLTAWPHDLFARMALGNIAYRQGQMQDAEAHYRQAAAEHPEAGDAWNNLAQVLYEQGNLLQAQGAASRAVALGGIRLGTYETTLGAVNAGLGHQR
jgi:Tfp pilus assembly protein PilF